MRRRWRGVDTLSSFTYFMLGLAAVTSLSFYQGYIVKLESSSIISNSWQWIASILFSWGILLIFFTSARRIVRAAWALVSIIIALGIGYYFSVQSIPLQYTDTAIRIDRAPSLSSDNQVSEEIFEASDLSQSYQQAVLESGWYTILDPARIEDDTDLVESYFIIDETRKAILKHLLQTQQQSYELEKKVYNSEASGVEEGYVKDLMYKSQVQKKIWKAELLALREVRSIINMLDENRDAWDVQNNTLIFYSDSDRQRFQHIMDKLQKIGEQQKYLDNLN